MYSTYSSAETLCTWHIVLHDCATLLSNVSIVGDKPKHMYSTCSSAETLVHTVLLDVQRASQDGRREGVAQAAAALCTDCYLNQPEAQDQIGLCVRYQSNPPCQSLSRSPRQNSPDLFTPDLFCIFASFRCSLSFSIGLTWLQSTQQALAWNPPLPQTSAQPRE